MSKASVPREKSAEEQQSVGAEEPEPEDELKHLREMIEGGYYSSRDVRCLEAVQVPGEAHARRAPHREAAARRAHGRGDGGDRAQAVRLADPAPRDRLHAADDRVLHEDRVPRVSGRARRRRRVRPGARSPTRSPRPTTRSTPGHARASKRPTERSGRAARRQTRAPQSPRPGTRRSRLRCGRASTWRGSAACRAGARTRGPS